MEQKTPSNGLAEIAVNGSWRKEFQNKKILEKWRIALDNEIYADVLFYVGPEREEIKCHRLILKLQSEKLAELLADGRDAYDLENFDPPLFRKFLKFLYTDQIQMDGKEAILMMHIAKQYEILELSKICSYQVQKDINIDNSAFILEQGRVLDAKNLSRKTHEFIIKNADEVFQTNGFEQLSIECVMGLIASKEKNISEINAFKAVRRWAKVEVESRQCVEATRENVYSAAERVFALIDFTKFSSREFSEHVVLTKSLPDAMLLAKLTELSMADKAEVRSPHLPFKRTKPEKLVKTTSSRSQIHQESQRDLNTYSTLIQKLDHIEQMSQMESIKSGPSPAKKIRIVTYESNKSPIVNKGDISFSTAEDKAKAQPSTSTTYLKTGNIGRQKSRTYKKSKKIFTCDTCGEELNTLRRLNNHKLCTTTPIL